MFSQLRMRRRNLQFGETTGGEEDVRFWAQAGAAGAGGALGEEGYGGGMDPMEHDFNQDFGGGESLLRGCRLDLD